MTNLCIVSCTTDSKENAETIATRLLEHQLAACVQIVPGITSVYRWENKVMQDQEFLLLIKTHQQKLADAEHLVTSLHTYDVPQWVVVEAISVSEAYGSWVKEALNIEKRK